MGREKDDGHLGEAHTNMARLSTLLKSSTVALLRVFISDPASLLSA